MIAFEKMGRFEKKGSKTREGGGQKKGGRGRGVVQKKRGAKLGRGSKEEVHKRKEGSAHATDSSRDSSQGSLR